MGTKELKAAREPVQPLLVSAKELSVALNVPRNTIYARAKKDGWPCYRIGSSEKSDIRFDLEEILALLRRDSG
jgi:hypothetical protein